MAGIWMSSFAALLFVAVPDPADEFEDRVALCWGESAAVDIRIDACTWLMKSGHLDRRWLPETLLQRGINLAETDQFESAIKDYNHAIRLKSDYVSAYNRRATAFLETGQFEKAMEDYKTVRRLDPPDKTWDVLGMAIALRKLGRFEEALRELEYAKSFDEDGGGSGPGMAYHFHLGATLREMGRYAEAVTVFTNGIPKQPDYSGIHCERALAYEGLGNLAAAKEDLKLVLRKWRVYFRNSAKPLKDIKGECAETLVRFGLPTK